MQFDGNPEAMAQARNLAIKLRATAIELKRQTDEIVRLNELPFNGGTVPASEGVGAHLAHLHLIAMAFEMRAKEIDDAIDAVKKAINAMRTDPNRN